MRIYLSDVTFKSVITASHEYDIVPAEHLADMEYFDEQAIREYVTAQHPSPAEIIYIDSGYENFIAVIDKQLVLRFPRTEQAAIYNDYEAEILHYISEHSHLPVPTVLAQHPKPVHAAMSFMEGQGISSSTFTALSSPEKCAIIQQITQFAHTLHAILPVNWVERQRSQHRLNDLDEPWVEHFHKSLIEQGLQNSTKDSLAKDLYHQWLKLKEGSRRVAVHDDLHFGNLLFANHQLVGVMDFALTSIGSPEQELRQLYRLGDDAVEIATEEYRRLSGKDVDKQAIKLWAIMQELASYVSRCNAGETTHPGFARAQKHLQKWLPEVDWSAD